MGVVGLPGGGLAGGCIDPFELPLEPLAPPLEPLEPPAESEADFEGSLPTAAANTTKARTSAIAMRFIVAESLRHNQCLVACKLEYSNGNVGNNLIFPMGLAFVIMLAPLRFN